MSNSDNTERMKVPPIIEVPGDKSVEALMARLDAVEKIQRVNVPKFVKALARLARVEKASIVAAKSMVALQADVTLQKERSERNAVTLETAQTTLLENTHKIDAIYGYIRGAATGWGWLRRHGSKLLTGVIGFAIAEGWITVTGGKAFLHIFGL